MFWVPNESNKMKMLGGAGVLLGLINIFVVYSHPGELRVPAWIAYLVATGFILIGIALLAGAMEIMWLQRLLGIAFAMTLLVVFAWIAFGPGERNCSLSMPLLGMIAPDTVCRGGFGIGSAFIAMLLCALVIRVVRSR